MAVNGVRRWQPQWAIAPGEILAEALEERAMSQVELARRTGRPLKTINEIVNGKASITADTALQLELVLRVPARFWLNLERDFSEFRARSREAERRADQSDWVTRFPLAVMRRQKLIPKARTKAESLEAVLRFFGVSSPEAWARQQEAVVASFLQSSVFKVNDESLAVWLRAGEMKAAAIEAKPFDQARLEALLPQLRRMSLLDPSVFSAELTKALAAVGVVVVFTRELPGTRVAGATRWLSPDRVLIQLSLRFRRDDQFWFAVFHELAHVLTAGRRRGRVEADLKGDDPEEVAANEFASEQLVPAAKYDPFVERGDFSGAAVKRFAIEVGVAPGVVVGRLQHDRRILFSSLNDMRLPVLWPEEAGTL